MLTHLALQKRTHRTVRPGTRHELAGDDAIHTRAVATSHDGFVRLRAFKRRRSTRAVPTPCLSRVFDDKRTIEGFKGRDVDLKWSIYDAKTDRRVAKPSLEAQVADRILDLASPSTRQVIQLWTPELVGHTRYFVRLELVDRAGTSLAIADSDDFAGI
jgi:hypothetical protein